MKNKIKYLAFAALATVLACGSQLVEFPADCDCPTAPPSQVGAPDPGEPDPTTPPVSTDAPPTEEPPVVEQDSGTPPEEDASTPPEEDAGQPAEDAGQPTEDAGTPPTDKDCGRPDRCDTNHGQCVSACAHECKKHHRQTCHHYDSCFKECKAKCDCALTECKKQH